MMKKINRNALCPCGSGRKYENCCSAQETPILKDLPFGMRMKGGIRSNPAGDGFVAIVHVWDNVECRGEPDEWRSQVFSTEEEAMQYYKTSIRPELERLMTQATAKTRGIRAIHKRLE